MAIAIFACVVVVVVIVSFVGPILLLSYSPPEKILPKHYKLSRIWALAEKECAKVRLITWRDKDDPNSFMLQMEGRDPKFLTGSKHKELVAWMREGLTPEQCYDRLG